MMKTKPHQWFADGNPPPTASGYLLPIDAVAGYKADSAQTLGATLFGDTTGFDFSRLIQAMVPSSGALPASPTANGQDRGSGLIAQPLDTPLVAEEPTQHLSYERTPDHGAAEATLVQPSLPAADVSVSTVADLYDDAARGLLASPLTTPLTGEEPAHRPNVGRIPDLGFLQNLPAIVSMPVPPLARPETVSIPADSAVLPVGSEPVAVLGGAPFVRADLLHELTSAIVAETNLPPTLSSGHEDLGVGLTSDLFVTEPALLPDLHEIQFLAVLPDPIVDPGPLV